MSAQAIPASVVTDVGATLLRLGGVPDDLAALEAAHDERVRAVAAELVPPIALLVTRLTGLLEQQARRREPMLGKSLSAREKEILGLLAEGMSNVEIAARLSLSPLTTKSHLARMARKLGTGDRAGMVGAGFRTGVLR